MSGGWYVSKQKKGSVAYRVIRLGVFALIVVVFLVGCNTDNPTATPEYTATPGPTSTSEPIPQPTPCPEAPGIPTVTPAPPTATPVPPIATDTPTPTATSQLTATSDGPQWYANRLAEYCVIVDVADGIPHSAQNIVHKLGHVVDARLGGGSNPNSPQSVLAAEGLDMTIGNDSGYVGGVWQRGGG